MVDLGFVGFGNLGLGFEGVEIEIEFVVEDFGLSKGFGFVEIRDFGGEERLAWCRRRLSSLGLRRRLSSLGLCRQPRIE